MIAALLLTLGVAAAQVPPEAAPAAAPDALVTGPDNAPEGADVPPTAAPDAPPAADEDDDAGLIPGLVPGPPPPADQVEPLTRDISEGLRCPVCQGLSVADSSSNAAVMMMRRVREMVAAGYTRTEIEDYFISKYGEWVLLDPRAGGLNQLVWIGPALAFALGLVAAIAFMRRAGTDGAVNPVPDPATPDDDYSRRILNEADDD